MNRQSFQDNAQTILTGLHAGWQLFEWQRDCLFELLIQKRDTFVIAPTASGKSLPIELLPHLSTSNNLVPRPNLKVPKVFIVVPLNALGDSLEKALSSSKLKIANVSKLTAEQEDELLKSPNTFSFFIFSPEKILMQKWLEVIRSCASEIVAFVVDEVHFTYLWGNKDEHGEIFRPEYGKLSKIRAQAPDAPMLAMTATATAKVSKPLF